MSPYYAWWAHLANIILKWGNYMDGKKIVLDLWAKICVLGICKVVSIIKLCVVNYIPGEGNGNPLQNPCLENLMDRGDWWAAI